MSIGAGSTLAAKPQTVTSCPTSHGDQSMDRRPTTTAWPQPRQQLLRLTGYLILNLALVISTAAAVSGQPDAPPCPDNLFEEIHALSHTGDEAGQFRRILQTIDEVRGVKIQPADLAATFVERLDCLGWHSQANLTAGSDAPPGTVSLARLLDKVTVITNGQAFRVTDIKTGQSREVRLRPDGSAGKSARKTVRLLEKEAGRLGLDREAVHQASWYLLVESCIALLEGPYNYYIYADQLVFSNAHNRGRSFRPGFVPALNGNCVCVDQVIDPRLEEAGLAEGDTILEMDGEQLAARPLADWYGHWFREQPFTFTVTVAREGHPVRLSGESVPHRHRTLHWAVHEKMAYVRIDSFTSGTLVEFRSVLHRTAKREVHGLVIDLRNNTGGVQQFDLVDIFFTPAQPVATSKRFSEEAQETVTGTIEYCGLPLVLLVNDGSASMSEVFAAAVKQNDRGTLVGGTTFGKGVGQRKYAIGSEGEIALLDRTFYYPGTDATWDGAGIEPHVAIAVGEEERNAIDAFLETEDVVLSDHLAIDTALARALDILKEER